MNAYQEEKSSLYKAVARNDIHLVDFYIKAGVDNAEVNFRSEESYTPLYEAVRNRNKNIAELLLKHGADAKAKISPHYVVFERYRHESNSTQMVDVIMQRGTHLYETELPNPVVRRSIQNYVKVAKIIIKNDNDLNTIIESGYTALHKAVRNDDPESVKILLKYDADINAKSKAGHTPMDEAIIFNNTKALDVLLDNFCDTNTYTAHQLFFNSLQSNVVDDDDTELGLGEWTANKLKKLKKHWISRKIKRHIIKIRCLGMIVSDHLLEIYPYGMSQLRNDCLKEIKKMKRKKIVDNISYYEILTHPHGIYKLILNIANSSDLMDLRLKDYRKKFPVYGEMLNSRFYVLKRIELLEYSRLFFKKYLSHNYTILPYLCVNLVQSFLSNQDLVNLIEIIENNDKA